MRRTTHMSVSTHRGLWTALSAVAARVVKTSVFAVLVLAVLLGGTGTTQPSSTSTAAASTAEADPADQVMLLGDVVLVGHYDKGKRVKISGGCDFGATDCYAYSKARGVYDAAGQPCRLVRYTTVRLKTVAGVPAAWVPVTRTEYTCRRSV